jgi:hypothetical protein
MHVYCRSTMHTSAKEGSGTLRAHRKDLARLWFKTHHREWTPPPPGPHRSGGKGGGYGVDVFHFFSFRFSQKERGGGAFFHHLRRDAHESTQPTARWANNSPRRSHTQLSQTKIFIKAQTITESLSQDRIICWRSGTPVADKKRDDRGRVRGCTDGCCRTLDARETKG